MIMTRRNFLKMSAAVGVASALPRAFAAKPDEMRAVLLHLGHNMWCDWFPKEQMARMRELYPKWRTELTPVPDDELRTVDALWRETTDHAAKRGLNAVVIDIGEGVVFPSHPEIAIRGSWSPDKLKDELERLRKLGLEPIPKLNFSTRHNGWMGEYRRMVSSTPYYRFCEDVIGDVAEIFGTPRYFHVGCDEEGPGMAYSPRCLYASLRKGELWWHDFLHVVRTSEKCGMRPWAWNDYGWDHPEEYLKRCPKSVLQCSWYYDEENAGFDPAANKTSDRKRLQAFWDLEKAGFDQTPCGTNWAAPKRAEAGVGADDVMGKLVRLGRKVIAPERLKGFVMASWKPCDTQVHVATLKRGIDLLAEAV